MRRRATHRSAPSWLRLAASPADHPYRFGPDPATASVAVPDGPFPTARSTTFGSIGSGKPASPTLTRTTA